ncbi:MAG: NADH dehydrogenase [Candidatus Lambdaproteobacteria bacterium RIFOXYD1_FULL_56_27]|uniref:NADH-quinone oxidoreductase subunit D n=1 Tax=Candidatus Lambdaproteobacteria bacterium RIFOXYD2_FULL_56_26 TaxID=1817773 RepID=A0A1F6H2X7_9PROT|nr:MAG: NADH dehydrogenase [Candidatus Lambdaproteobacteria bacterium RIFOXYD2_FULL_56_26]OGH09208.1 MAG: NADH dehydrogenase [Candidatus Lambdaproteobacteria bacterium RIFOXYD1_FULL_56_27]
MGKQLRTELMTINMGPQHPSTHGVIRFIIKTDGEVIHECQPDVGYLHRSIEKISEKVNWQGFVPFTDRVDYLASMNANWAYCFAVERMLGTEVPRRAEFLRVMVGELNRISSHLIAIGATAMDLGGFTPFIQLLREREYINDLLEMACGARLTYNYISIGGVNYDVPRNWTEKVGEFLEHFELAMEQMNRLISYNRIFINRMANLAVIPREMAIQYNLVGPNLRGSGVKFDLRRDHPYSVYPELDFEVPVGVGIEGQVGDCYDRYHVRMMEIRESINILRQCIKMMPPGEIQGKVKNVIKPPEGTIHVRTETPRGDTGYLIQSDGKTSAYRLKIRTGSFTAMSVIPAVAPGLFIADLIALIGSLDVVAPELDR